MSTVESRYGEWLTLFASRNEVADWYADQLAWAGPNWGGWKFVNAAILHRWSASGLRYIKSRAWQVGHQSTASATAPDCPCGDPVGGTPCTEAAPCPYRVVTRRIAVLGAFGDSQSSSSGDKT